MFSDLSTLMAKSNTVFWWISKRFSIILNMSKNDDKPQVSFQLQEVPDLPSKKSMNKTIPPTSDREEDPETIEDLVR